MLIGAVSAYSYSHANQPQHVGFKGGEIKRIATVQELLAEAARCGAIIDGINRATGQAKGMGEVIVELSKNLNPKPNVSPLGKLQRNEAGRNRLFGELEPLLRERAAQLEMDVRGKTLGVIAREVIETERLLARFPKYGISPQSKDLAGLRAEVAEIEATYKDAERLGIRTEGKDLPTVLRELSSAPKTPRSSAANPQGASGAGKPFARVSLVKKARSITEILETSPKTREEAIMVFNALGVVFKANKAECLRANAIETEIKAAYRELVQKVHTDKNPNKLKHVQSLNEAKTLLFSK